MITGNLINVIKLPSISPSTALIGFEIEIAIEIGIEVFAFFSRPLRSRPQGAQRDHRLPSSGSNRLLPLIPAISLTNSPSPGGSRQVLHVQVSSVSISTSIWIVPTVRDTNNASTMIAKRLTIYNSIAFSLESVLLGFWFMLQDFGKTMDQLFCQYPPIIEFLRRFSGIGAHLIRQ